MVLSISNFLSIY